MRIKPAAAMINQTDAPDLFQTVQGSLVPNARRYPAAPGFKRAGTSQQAAAATKARDTALRDRVLEVLQKRNCTSDEVADILGETPFSIRPRVSQLFSLGCVVDTSERRRNASGHSATVWAAVKLGK